MAHRRDGALHDEHIRAGILRDPPELFGLLRDRTDGGDRAAVLNLLHARGDQIFLDRFLVDFLEERGDLGFVGPDNLVQNFLRTFVAGLDAFQIQHREPAEFAHLDRELHVDHTVHRAGQDRDLQLDRLGVASWNSECRVDFVRIDSDASGDESNLIEPISHASFAIAADPHSHN